MFLFSLIASDDCCVCYFVVHSRADPRSTPSIVACSPSHLAGEAASNSCENPLSDVRLRTPRCSEQSETTKKSWEVLDIVTRPLADLLITYFGRNGIVGTGPFGKRGPVSREEIHVAHQQAMIVGLSFRLLSKPCANGQPLINSSSRHQFVAPVHSWSPSSDIGSTFDIPLVDAWF